MIGETNNLIPAEVFPPGEFILDELEARGWSQQDFAEILKVSQSTLSLIINGKRSINPEMAKAIADAFGTSPDIWLNLENAYQLSQLKSEDRGIAGRAKLYSLAPIGEMVKRGWIEQATNVNALESELKRFFETNDLTSISELEMAARKSAEYAAFSIPERAWKFRVRRLARAVDVKRFDPSQVARDLPKLRTLTQYPENIRKLPAMFASWGIRLVLVSHLERTKLDGATMWLDSEKTQPIIALTLRYDRIDYFWFTLIHECVHVKYRETSVDSDLLSDAKGDGGEGSNSENEVEIRANREAAQILVPQDKMDSFILRTRPLYSRDKVEKFAQLHGIHPGLVVGQLHHRKEIPSRNLRDLLVQNGIRSLIVGQALTDGWGHQAGAF